MGPGMKGNNMRSATGAWSVAALSNGQMCNYKENTRNVTVFIKSVQLMMIKLNKVHKKFDYLGCFL